MHYLITKTELKKALLNQLVKDFRDKDFTFFSDEMNKTFITQTSAYKNDYFFTCISELKVFEDELYCLSHNEVYEEAYKKTYKMIENDFKYNKNRVIEYDFTEDKEDNNLYF